MAELKCWGLTRDERRMVLGIRAAGILLFGLGLSVVGVVADWMFTYAREFSVQRGVGSATMFDLIVTKGSLLSLAAWVGPKLAALAMGVYLMRRDPRGWLGRVLP